MLNKPPPSPTNNVPLIWLFTTKPKFGETDAVVEPDIILSNCKIIAKGTPSELVKDSKAQNAYFGDSFRLS